jgi:hypothetical protein
MLLLNECFLLFISLSTQSRNFWIHPRVEESGHLHTPAVLSHGISKGGGVRRPGCEADHSPPSSAEDAWSCTSNLPYVFMS